MTTGNSRSPEGSAKKLEVDTAQTIRFLTHLDEDADYWTFQVFDDGERGADDGGVSPRHWQGTLRGNIKKLASLNNDGAGIYATINRIEEGKGRGNKYVQDIRAVFLDLDGKELAPALSACLEPHLIIETSPGRYHAYWFVSPGLSKKEFRQIQTAIANRFAGDESIKDPARVMRIPGFYNRKDLRDDPRLEEPFQVRIHEDNPTRRYTPEEIRDTFGLREKRGEFGGENGTTRRAEQSFSLPDKITEGGRNNAMTQYAGSIWTEEMTQKALLEKLKKENKQRCKPPLPTNELESIARQAGENWDPAPEPGSDDFSPVSFARSVLRTEKMRGRRYAYVVSQGAYYRYRDKEGAWRRTDDEYIKNILRAEGLEKKYVVNEVLEALKHEVLDEENDIRFDPGSGADRNHINFQNGVFDWRTGQMGPHEPERYDLVQIPHEFDPEAECPEWKSALSDWIKEKDTRLFLQEFVGYCLIPDASRDRYVILTGTGRNGKSTFLQVIEELFGPSNCTGIPLHKLTNKPRFETHNLMGSLVNICADIDAEYIKRTGTLKQIVSGERIRGEYKHGKSFDFTPFARLIFSANEIPKSSDKTDAWYRRMEVVPFPNRFNPEDPDTDVALTAKLAGSNKYPGEIQGVINWALEGLRRLEERGHFKESQEMQESLGDYQRSNDSVLAFVEDRIEFTVDPEDRIPAQALYERYKKYCEKNGLIPTSQTTLGSRLNNELEINSGLLWEKYCVDHDRWKCDFPDCMGVEEKKRRTTYRGIKTK